MDAPEVDGWFRFSDLTSPQLERIRERARVLIEQSAYPDPILCIIAAYVIEVNEEYARLDAHGEGHTH